MSAHDRPCHLVAVPGDKRTVCGIKSGTEAAYPVMWTKAALEHCYEFVKCEACYLGAGLGQLLIAHLTIPPEMTDPRQVPLDT